MEDGGLRNDQEIGRNLFISRYTRKEIRKNVGTIVLLL